MPRTPEGLRFPAPAQSGRFLVVVLGWVALASLVVVPVESAFPITFPKLALLSLATACVLVVWGISLMRGISGVAVMDVAAIKRTAAYTWAVLAFCAALALTVALSKNPSAALWGNWGRNTGVILYASLAVLAIAFSTSATSVKPRAVHDAHLTCCAFAVAYGIVQIAGLDMVHWTGKGPISFFGNLDQAGCWYAMAATSALAAVSQVDRMRWQQIACGVLAALSVLLVVALYRPSTRIDQAGIILAIGTTLLLVPFVRRIPVGIRNRYVVPSLVVAGIGVAVWLGGAVLQSNGAVHRWIMWRSVIQLIGQAPVLGIGFGRLGIAYLPVRSDEESRLYGSEAGVDDAHSVPLQIMLNGGLVLAIPYLVLTGIVLRRALQAIWNTAGAPNTSLRLLAVLAVLYIVQSLFSPELVGLAIWGWIAGAVVVASTVTNAATSTEGSGVPPRLQPVGRIVGFTVAAIGVLQMAVTLNQIKTEVALTRFTQWAGSGSMKGHSRLSMELSQAERRRSVASIMSMRPGDVWVAMQLARVLRTAKDYDGVIGVDSMLLRYEPKSITVRMDLAEALREVGHPELGLKHLEQIVQDVPRIPKHWFFAAHAAAMSGDTVKARALFMRGEALIVEIGLTDERVAEGLRADLRGLLFPGLIDLPRRR